MKADDDTFVYPYNLMSTLDDFSSEEPKYLGHTIRFALFSDSCFNFDLATSISMIFAVEARVMY